MQNHPLLRKELQRMHTDSAKQALITRLSQTKEYRAFKFFREQLIFLFETGKQQTDIPRLTYRDLSYVFNEPFNTVKHAIQMGRRQYNGEILSNGRPFSLSDEQNQRVKEWIESHGDRAPKLRHLQNFIADEFNIVIEYKTMKRCLEKIGFETVDAFPLEESRYNVDENDLNLFFAELKEFATTNAIPPFMAFNLDEEGHDEFVDAHNLKIIVKIDSKNKHRKFV